MRCRFECSCSVVIHSEQALGYLSSTAQVLADLRRILPSYSSYLSEVRSNRCAGGPSFEFPDATATEVTQSWYFVSTPATICKGRHGTEYFVQGRARCCRHLLFHIMLPRRPPFAQYRGGECTPYARSAIRKSESPLPPRE